MIIIASHIFTNIFQMEHTSDGKFPVGYDKNVSCHLRSKSKKSFKKLKFKN